MHKTVFGKTLTVKITTKNFCDLAIWLEDLIFCLMIFLVGLNFLVVSVKKHVVYYRFF